MSKPAMGEVFLEPGSVVTCPNCGWLVYRCTHTERAHDHDNDLVPDIARALLIHMVDCETSPPEEKTQD